MPEAFRADHPDIAWRDIRHFRNFMIHVYDQIDPARLFDTTTTSLPELAEQLRTLLDNL